ncbi:hypothetical protein B0A48_09562 [Cryoendolithus antarcticus]|uniref:Uncharacterized protein n=1 Tax=Cryoendolithus antarcticus TaxID=1507870 RepID=A0A1V8SZY3_9PEZI|nr:hypothetical protein B0A48_09562 [Cryoendolithus antarcticus]
MPPSGVSSLKRQIHAEYSGVPRFVSRNKASAASPIDDEPSEVIVVSDDEPSEGVVAGDDEPSEGLIVSAGENKTSNGVIVNDDENDEVDFTRTDDVSPIRIVRTIEPASTTGYRVTRPPVLSSPSGIEDSELYGVDVDGDTDFDETQQLIPSDFEEGCSDASFVAPLISDDGGAVECGGEDTVTLAGRIDEESVNGSSGAAYDDSAFLTGAIGSDDLTKDDGMGGMSEWANDGAAGAVVVIATRAMK